MKKEEPILARDIVSEKVSAKKLDVWYDRVFVRSLIKAVQRLDDNIGAVVYKDTRLIVFFWQGLIVGKILMDETNTDKISISQHVKKIKDNLSCLKLGLIPVRDRLSIKQAMRGLNPKAGQHYY